MAVRVFDTEGQERDLVWLAANYDGCHPEFVTDKIDITLWRRYFALVAIYCTKGDVTLKVEARDENGAPMAGIWGGASWPSLAAPDPKLDDLSNSGAPYVWTTRGKVTQTNNEGIAGHGIGTFFGPFYQMWIVSPSTPSDCLVMAGMKGGTFHYGPLHAVFQLKAVVAPVPDPDPDPVPDPVPDPSLPDRDFLKMLAMTLVTRVNGDGSYLTPDDVVSNAAAIEQGIRDVING